MQTREWYDYHLNKLHDMFCGIQPDHIEDMLNEFEILSEAVSDAAGMSQEDAIFYVDKKLIDSKAERHAFYERQSIQSENVNICNKFRESYCNI